ncbi:hypothetical protein OHA72_46595 [Dactylosporangium sp. NBC_01737]|uniref:competence protein CoiA family protein n=1 Tax=Dactylosporangium sp. NBC_01737 TaxID=2975959 RepID=UPI002E0F9764|nr:hypothetical protein OHA72_46595 [Dactylosporangium sp. NBC_01737]
MRAKVLLAQRFREHGHEVALEEPHSGGWRRVDVAVTIQGRNGPVRVAVEVQDSAIAVDELQRRNHADKRAGFFATVWMFTTNRLSRARGSLPGAELRLPEEVRYLNRRWHLPVAVLDVQREPQMLVSTAISGTCSTKIFRAQVACWQKYRRTMRSSRTSRPPIAVSVRRRM